MKQKKIYKNDSFPLGKLVLLLIALNIKYKASIHQWTMHIYIDCMQGICLALNIQHRALLHVHAVKCLQYSFESNSNYDWVYYSYNWIISIVLMCAFSLPFTEQCWWSKAIDGFCCVFLCCCCFFWISLFFFLGLCVSLSLFVRETVAAMKLEFMNLTFNVDGVLTVFMCLCIAQTRRNRSGIYTVRVCAAIDKNMEMKMKREYNAKCQTNIEYCSRIDELHVTVRT